MSTKFLEGIRVGEFVSSLNNTSKQNLRSEGLREGAVYGFVSLTLELVHPWDMAYAFHVSCDTYWPKTHDVRKEGERRRRMKVHWKHCYMVVVNY